MTAAASQFAQTFFHGTRADLNPGGLIVVGHASNFTQGQALSWVYFTATASLPNSTRVIQNASPTPVPAD